MRLRSQISLVAACTLFLSLASARADFVTRPLLNHPSAIPGFTGSTHWTLSGMLGSVEKRLDVNVDYAVFSPDAPYQYPRDLSNFLPYATFIQTFGPPKPTDYIYAYQIYNNPASNDNFFFLSVGIESNTLVNSLGRDLGFDPAGIDAVLAFLGLDGAKYFMFFGGQGPELAPGQFSTVLLMSSPFQPTFGDSYVFSGSGLTGQACLPTPAPTPSAVIAGCLGFLILAGWRFARRA